MAITYDSIERSGNVVTVTVTSDLADPYYHWYVEGSWMGMTRTGELSVAMEDDAQEFDVCQDTTDADYDAVANAPAGYPSRLTLGWTASTDSDIDHYRIEQNKDAAGWTELGTVPDDGRWEFRYVTGRLTDLSSYQWRIVPVDAAGNDGTATTLDAQTVVRRPDAVDFDAEFNAPATTVTFSEAT